MPSGLGGDRSPASKAVRRYLDGYARHDRTSGWVWPHAVDHAIVIPLRGETDEFVDGVVPAVSPDHRALCIVVINGSDADPEWMHRTNAATMKVLSSRESALAKRGVRLHIIDHASPGRRFPTTEGVGLARRIGTDLAVDLWAHGRLRSPWIHGTDADARLPPGLFATADAQPRDAVALTFPYWHVESGDAPIDHATALYEIWLRYYVLGLASAGSPYAMQTVGSALAVHAWAYAAARGFPLRQAGEDFHLLAKLAKLGAVVRPAVPPIRVMSRRSHRTPFGTGRAVETRVDQATEPNVYDPRVFEVLRHWLQALENLSDGPSKADGTLFPLPHRLSGIDSIVAEALADIGVETLGNVLDGAPDHASRRRRLHQWFDALKTLRFLRRLRRHFPDVPWSQAVQEAPFFRGAPSADDPLALRRWALDREASLPPAGLHREWSVRSKNVG